MKRSTMFSVRLSETERRLVARIAEQMERTESDAVRQLIREAARLLGLTPAACLPLAETDNRPRLPPPG